MKLKRIDELGEHEVRTTDSESPVLRYSTVAPECFDPDYSEYLCLAAGEACINLLLEMATKDIGVGVIELQSNAMGEYAKSKMAEQKNLTSLKVQTRVIVPEGKQEESLQQIFQNEVDRFLLNNGLITPEVTLSVGLRVDQRYR
ncbi:MAG: hypothetical protein JSW61_08275 [Candidatus Thorarchaeota archaeon]|nr:MAG: hypothetical protein JSW61_08275 [Candidatus Thorarchaeota archaeon]